VQLGARRPGELEILSGINEGELVVAHGTMSVRSGGEVLIRAKEQGNMKLRDMLASDKG
jgi:membrane fusion protein (multidrug efflux system)